MMLNLVGSVPTCEVAASLFKEYENKIMMGINPEIPLGGIILQAAIYTGTFIHDLIVSIGKSILPAGCLIRNKDPYDNAKHVKSIPVQIIFLFLYSVQSFIFMEQMMKSFLFQKPKHCMNYPNLLIHLGGSKKENIMILL